MATAGTKINDIESQSSSSKQSSGERAQLITKDQNVVVIGDRYYSNQDVLDTTCMPFVGIWEDMSRYHIYWTDIVDGFGSQQIASIFYIFFACITPAIAFGGLMGEVTEQAIGTIEMLLATTVVGVFMALFSSQPLTIYGGTGPLLLFTQVLFNLCKTLDLNFLPIYAWTGLWTGLFCIILGVINSSNLIKYFTRFTDEIFAALISIIFIYEAVSAIVKEFKTDTPEKRGIAFLSAILAVLTYFLIVFFKAFKNTIYLVPTIRSIISDFAPVIALAVLTLVDFIFKSVETEKLLIPDRFVPTSGRPWLVPMLELQTWAIFATILPALLATLLVYLDQNITARIINSGKHKLRKRPGFHLDLTLVGIAIAAVSIFGLPWLVAATVRALSNTYALAVFKMKPDGTKVVHHIKENRLTEVAIHLLIGASLLITMVMKQIPMAVLYGIFLYMGFSSIEGNEFFDRIFLLFVWKPTAYPNTAYTRNVSLLKVHLFTITQLFLFGLLWAVKSTVLAISFPLFIVVLAPIRLFILPCFWSGNELENLDSESELDEDDEDSKKKKDDDGAGVDSAEEPDVETLTP